MCGREIGDGGGKAMHSLDMGFPESGRRKARETPKRPLSSFALAAAAGAQLQPNRVVQFGQADSRALLYLAVPLLVLEVLRLERQCPVGVPVRGEERRRCCCR